MVRGTDAIPIRIDEVKINKVEHFTVVCGIRSISVDLMCCARFTIAPRTLHSLKFQAEEDLFHSLEQF